MDSIKVGIYRGSFDPPHNGHLETASSALDEGIHSLVIIYKDPNRLKPFRSQDKTRKKLLEILFKDRKNITISDQSYREVFNNLSSNPQISTIYHIMGSDLLNISSRPIKKPTKLSYLIFSRPNYPISSPISTWNDLPARVSCAELHHQHLSSTALQRQIFFRQIETARSAFPVSVFDQIKKDNLFSSTDNQYLIALLFQEVKKILEKEIIAKQILPQEKYPLSLHLGSDIGMGGLSGDVLCFVKDREQKICLVLKIFISENFKEKYESEILGYKIIHQLKLNTVSIPTLFFSLERDFFACICMSFAEGKSLAQLMGNSAEAIRLCAQANLELHLANRILAKIGTSDIAIYGNVLDKVIENVNKIDASFFPSNIESRLRKRWEGIEQSFMKNPGLFSYTHGDPNHHNWIIDLANNRVTYIDLSLFKRSVSPSGIPCRFAIDELEESLLTFRIAAKQMGQLSDKKIGKIQQIYRTEYLTRAPNDISTPEAEIYFRSYWLLVVTNTVFEKFLKAKQSKYQNSILKNICLFLNSNKLEN